MSLVFSGVQPTGNLHLGNYLGAIKQWVDIQHQHKSLFCIVDLHAITVPQDSASLRESIYSVAALYIAAGIDPQKSIIFNQSRVSAHCELSWILSCNTPLGWLNRMTQFKEKAGKNKENASLGLYGYPVLMAADILAYNATHVPVGEDQKQHLELARDIAGAFNRNYGVEFFTPPEPLILGAATRVMSLRDGRKKMSKSDESDFSRINMTDSADVIADKVKRAKSDSIEGISYDEETRPEVANLINIYCAVTGEGRDAAVNRFAPYNFSKFKSEIADALVAKLAPINETYQKLIIDRQYLSKLLDEGAEKADAIAGANLKKIKEIVGFI